MTVSPRESYGGLWKYGVPGPLVRAIRSLYKQSESCVHILGTKSSTYFGLHQGCPLSLNLKAQPT